MAGGDIQDSRLSGCILSAIVRRNLDPSVQLATQEEISEALHRLRTVRLDREGITVLRDLEMVNQTHSLYLQMNQIKKIENIDVLKNLRFLSLSGNKIVKIPNFHCLQKLRFLDLSHNLIQMLDTGGLPQTILILSLIGNACTKTQDYGQQVMKALPYLQELDGETVGDTAGQESSSDSEDGGGSDTEDNSQTFEHSGLTSMGQEIMERSHQRRNRATSEHVERLAELSDAANTRLHASSGNGERQDSTSWSKPVNIIIPKKPTQTPAVTEKKPKEHQNSGISVAACKPRTTKQVPASPIQNGARSSGLRLNTSTKKTATSDPLPKIQQRIINTSGKIAGRTTQNTSNGRPALSAPTIRRLQLAPTKTPVQPLPTHGTTMTSAVNDRHSAPASSSRKLQTASSNKSARK